MDGPDVTITDRIMVRPELLTMRTPGNSNSSADGTEPAADNGGADAQEEADDQKLATAADYANFLDLIANSRDYANQETER